jgi:hypothetical protein
MFKFNHTYESFIDNPKSVKEEGKLTTTRLHTFTYFTTRLHKNVQLDCAHIFWLPVTKISSVRTRLLIIVDYYTPCDYDI